MSRFVVCLSMLFAAAPVAHASIPEAGFYVDPFRPGIGFALEVQGNRLGIIVYAYAEDGEPEFFTAGGELRLQEGVLEDPVGEVHLLRASLFRPRDGFGLLSRAIFPFESPPPDFADVAVGEIFVRFANASNGSISLVIDQPQQGMSAGSVTREIVRMSFGYPALGPGFRYVSNGCWPDLRGDWVFVDADQADAEPIRVNLHALEEPTPTEQTCSNRTVKIYRDVARGLALTCVISDRPEDFTGGIVHYGGCELRDSSGHPVLSFIPGNMGLQRIQARRGGLPSSGSIAFGNGEVVGFRIR
jgi:hypothetical protein